MRTSARPNAARQMTGLTMAGAAKVSRGRPACSLATRQASHCSKRRVGSRRAKPPPIADHCRAGCDDLDPLPPGGAEYGAQLPRSGPSTSASCAGRQSSARGGWLKRSTLRRCQASTRQRASERRDRAGFRDCRGHGDCVRGSARCRGVQKAIQQKLHRRGGLA